MLFVAYDNNLSRRQLVTQNYFGTTTVQKKYIFLFFTDFKQYAKPYFTRTGPVYLSHKLKQKINRLHYNVLSRAHMDDQKDSFTENPAKRKH